jgi:hypothetical protein
MEPSTLDVPLGQGTGAKAGSLHEKPASQSRQESRRAVGWLCEYFPRGHDCGVEVG